MKELTSHQQETLKAIENFEGFWSLKNRGFTPLNDLRRTSGLPETSIEEIKAKRLERLLGI